MELFDMTTSNALRFSVDRVMYNHPALTREEANVLVKNALMYRRVVDEIAAEVDFLLKKGARYEREGA